MRWLLILLALLAVFAGLRVVSSLDDDPTDASIGTERIVVIGYPGPLDQTETALLQERADEIQVGAMSVRTREMGECVAAGWFTLGAGRRTTVGGLCDPQVIAGKVANWQQYVNASAAHRGDATPGLLGESASGCVAAVGPGAALATAQADGSLAKYATLDDFLAGKGILDCPITLIDPGATGFDRVLTLMAAREDVTLIVTGVGPAAGEAPSLQRVYRLGTTLPGYLTSASTRRDGIVTLNDLTRTLVDFAPGPDLEATHDQIDGNPLQVGERPVDLGGFQQHLAAVAALSDAAPTGYLVVGVGGGMLLLLGVVLTLRGSYRIPRLILTFGSVLPASMMLVSVTGWWRTGQPALVLSIGICLIAGLMTAAALGLGRLLRVPAVVAAAGLAVAAFTADAALGGVLQPGSMLNSRPIFGWRWYGFGNVTFAAYAAAGLFLAGYVAHRFLIAGRRLAALIATAAIGFGVMLCDGWPGMGTDFGGVVALTPPVLWLLLAISGVQITWPKVGITALLTVLAIGIISVLDWRRGPAARSHLGNFVQRVIDGDALLVVSRKAVASIETIVSPLGLASLVIGIALWIVLVRGVLPIVTYEFTTLRHVCFAALATASLGTILNDGGISVWITASGAMMMSVGWLWFDRGCREGVLRLAAMS